jgi:hypothetical protein
MDRRSLLASGLTGAMLLPLSAPARAGRSCVMATSQGHFLMPSTPESALTAAEARAIAKDAYIYGFAPVDNYRILYSYFVDRSDPEYKAPWNTIFNDARACTPDDTAIQTPNCDTPYSFVGADLRAEPLVFTAPPIEEDRYFSLEFIDLYTFIFAYIGSRTTGNGGGSFLLAGPGWRDEIPAGITSVIYSETELALVIYRTQLFNPNDIEQVKHIQAGYQVQPLSAFLGEPAPAAAPTIEFLKPLTEDEQRTSLRFFDELNFILHFCPTHPSEIDLMARFARLGIGAGKDFEPESLPTAIYQAVQDGMADAWEAYNEARRQVITGELSTADLVGTREYLQNNYFYRMIAAVISIFPNAKEEALYPLYSFDAEGQALDGSSHRYALRFAPGQLPPVNAFWSVTLYELPSRLLSANPLNRYLINSPMLPDLTLDADGGITLYIQHDSPGADKEANWLPAPSGPFYLAMRLYWPKPEALAGTWTPPPLQRLS